ncbi:matrixin family metalloprotease [Myxococcus sp. AM001]|uniref:matrixin family metalloprotease n=1 Tax=Myxococcus vastator TaxID=2709664 RepID=UPI0013D8212B|nr:matrixin family metalloprotease [Myxococcus vastator]NVJ08915.1 matrixin family metalloprotease [Myxococcus sp. AM001]
MRETNPKKTATTLHPKRSWILPLALLGALGCTNDGAEEPVPPVQEDVQVTAWVPGTSAPSHTHVEGSEHSLVMDWVRGEGSIEDLTDHSALIIHGQVESTRFDVMRAHAKSKVEGQPTDEESGAYSDLPVTIATVRINDIARTSAGLKSASGGVVAQGTTVEVVFPGGLLSDGCMLAPADNPLPKLGERAVFFLTPQGGDKPVAASALTELYSVTGGPLGRIPVQDGRAQGEPVEALIAQVEARASSAQYLGPDTHQEPTHEAAPGAVTAQNWCGLANFGYRWCRRPTNVTFTDYTSTRWPVGDAMNAWMYTSVSNSLYLHWRGSGASDVMVYEAWYGATGWAGYATNSWSGACLTRSTIQLNNSYHTGAHYAKTVSIHEIGHSLGFAHHGNCNSIMYSSPTVCAAATTTCDAQAAAGLYPY